MSESETKSSGGSKFPKVVVEDPPIKAIEHRCWCGERKIDRDIDNWGFDFWTEHRAEHKKEQRKEKVKQSIST